MARGNEPTICLSKLVSIRDAELVREILSEMGDLV